MAFHTAPTNIEQAGRFIYGKGPRAPLYSSFGTRANQSVLKSS